MDGPEIYLLSSLPVRSKQTVVQRWFHLCVWVVLARGRVFWAWYGCAWSGPPAPRLVTLVSWVPGTSQPVTQSEC